MAKTVAAPNVEIPEEVRQIDLRWELITPKVAANYLQSIDRNRVITDDHVNFLSKQMVKGNWKVVLLPIMFSQSGKLYDAQHRLSAVIKSGKEQWMLVARHVPDDVFPILDTGRGRKAQDVISVHGVKHYTAVASIVRFILSFQAGSYSPGGNRVDEATNLEIEKFFLENRDEMEDIAAMAKSWNYHMQHLLPPSIIGGLYYMFAMTKEEWSFEFMKKLCVGSELQEGSPILQLRNQFNQDRLNPRRLSYRTKAAMIIHVWNAWRKGQTLKRIPEDANPFPKIL